MFAVASQKRKRQKKRALKGETHTMSDGGGGGGNWPNNNNNNNNNYHHRQRAVAVRLFSSSSFCFLFLSLGCFKKRARFLLSLFFEREKRDRENFPAKRERRKRGPPRNGEARFCPSLSLSLSRALCSFVLRERRKKRDALRIRSRKALFVLNVVRAN